MRVRREERRGVVCANKACKICYREASPKEIMEAQEATRRKSQWDGRTISSACYMGAHPNGVIVEMRFEDGGEQRVTLSYSEHLRLMKEGTPCDRFKQNRFKQSQSEPTTSQEVSLPEDDELRGQYPMADGLLDYFPNALAEVSRISKRGSDKHNKGEDMHWARSKSTDHRNKIMRHLVDAGRLDSEGVRHSANLAWRALALLQEELEREEGYPMSRASRK